MGLAICRSIVETHDARIWVTPGVLHGAVFQFTLPTKGIPQRYIARRRLPNRKDPNGVSLTASKRNDHRADRTDDSSDRFAIADTASVFDRRARRAYLGTQCRMVGVSNTTVISIVDDDESVRKAMRGMVESFGFAVFTFASGAEFLASDRLRDSACVILDVRMPGMNGLELQNRLIASGHSIPTILLTAFPDEKVRDRAMKAGAIAFLSKPCDRDDLLAHIHAALASRTSGGQRP